MQWRPCEEFPDYEVSECGWVRRIGSGKFLRPFLSHGYEKYSLYRDGKQFNVFGHRLVAVAFVGPPPFDGAQACHRDGTRNYNHYSNLRWDTAKGNAADMVAHGTRRFGGHPRSGTKLTPYMVRVIKACLAAGDSQLSIAPRFNVAGQTISKIARGKIWANVI